MAVNTPAMLTVSEAAKRLNVSQTTILYNLKNELPYTQTDGEPRISEDNLHHAWITTSEAARYLGVERERVRTLATRQNAFHYRRDGHHVYVPMDEVQRRKEGHATKPVGRPIMEPKTGGMQKHMHRPPKAAVRSEDYAPSPSIEALFYEETRPTMEVKQHPKLPMLMRIREDADKKYGGLSNVPDAILEAYPIDGTTVKIVKRFSDGVTVYSLED